MNEYVILLQALEDGDESAFIPLQDLSEEIGLNISNYDLEFVKNLASRKLSGDSDINRYKIPGYCCCYECSNKSVSRFLKGEKYKDLKWVEEYRDKGLIWEDSYLPGTKDAVNKARLERTKILSNLFESKLLGINPE